MLLRIIFNELPHKLSVPQSLSTRFMRMWISPAGLVDALPVPSIRGEQHRLQRSVQVGGQRVDARLQRVGHAGVWRGPRGGGHPTPLSGPDGRGARVSVVAKCAPRYRPPPRRLNANGHPEGVTRCHQLFPSSAMPKLRDDPTGLKCNSGVLCCVVLSCN